MEEIQKVDGGAEVAPGEVGGDVAAVVEPQVEAQVEPQGEPQVEPQGAAAAMREAYGFGVPESDDGGGGESLQEEPVKEEGYAVVYPEGFAVDETFAALVEPIARESGVDGEVFGGLTAKVVRAIQDAEYANMVETDAQLKGDWGADYDANMKRAKATAWRLMKQSGLSEADLQPLQSPKGARLLFAISQLTGEGAAAGAVRGSASEASWAKAVISDAKHPDYKDFRDVNSPRWRALNERYNRAMGVM